MNINSTTNETPLLSIRVDSAPSSTPHIEHLSSHQTSVQQERSSTSSSESDFSRNVGYRMMAFFIITLVAILGIITLIDLFKLTKFSNGVTLLISIAFGVLNFGTNLGAGLLRTKTFIPFYLSGISWIIGMVLCYLVKGSWAWSERLCALILPFVISANYLWLWLGYRRRRNYE